MFDTITSVEEHGNCFLKPSSSMKLNFFLSTMWYARKSNGSRTVASQQYSMNYASLLLLIIRAQLFIIPGEHKVRNNCSVGFLSLLSIHIPVGSVPRFFDSCVAPPLLSSVFLRSSKPPAPLYILSPSLAFSLAALSPSCSFPSELNPSSSLNQSSAKQQYQFQRAVLNLADVHARWIIIFLTLLWALAQNESNERMSSLSPCMQGHCFRRSDFFLLTLSTQISSRNHLILLVPWGYPWLGSNPLPGHLD